MITRQFLTAPGQHLLTTDNTNIISCSKLLSCGIWVSVHNTEEYLETYTLGNIHPELWHLFLTAHHAPLRKSVIKIPICSQCGTRQCHFLWTRILRTACEFRLSLISLALSQHMSCLGLITNIYSTNFDPAHNSRKYDLDNWHSGSRWDTTLSLSLTIVSKSYTHCYSIKLQQTASLSL